MATPRTVSITGDATDGYTWTCGTCGAVAATALATYDAATTDFTTHYNNAPSTPVDSWLLALLNAGQQLANGASGAPAQAWASAILGAPATTIATWRGGGITHPQ